VKSVNENSYGCGPLGPFNSRRELRSNSPCYRPWSPACEHGAVTRIGLMAARLPSWLMLVTALTCVFGVSAVSAAGHQSSVTRRIRLLTGWLNPPAETPGARQTTTWFYDRPAHGCQPRMTGSGRQIIEFWEPESRLTLLHFHRSSVTPATVSVEAKVSRYGTLTIHAAELPPVCVGARGQVEGDPTIGVPDPKWAGSEHVSGGGFGALPGAGVPGPLGAGGAGICGAINGTVDLHFALRGRRLHMTGGLHYDGVAPFAECPFFGGGEPPTAEYLYKLVPIDLPTHGDILDRRDSWVGVNVQPDPHTGVTHIALPLVRHYRGSPHGSTVLDASMKLELWPPEGIR
jgi:hypothetical protein